jgi:uncharacterized membrane protein YbhN (UPF0104 family)
MKAWLRRWGWPLAKVLLAVAILVGVCREFANNLNQLDRTALTVRPAWLVLSAVLYLTALAGSAWYWYHLLHLFGEGPRLLPTFRAYYLGHLGKYVPGKAWALLLRGQLVRMPETESRLGVAIISSFYEVLTTMAAGALLAAVLFAAQALAAPAEGVRSIHFEGWPEVHPILLGAALVALCGVPLLPAVFNRVVARLARRFQKVESFQLPRLRMKTLALGLVVTGTGWCVLGVGVWAMVQAVVPEPPALTPRLWALYTAAIGLGYVAGFLALFMPSGIGVREFVVELFLAPTLSPTTTVGRGLATVVALVLRLTWTVAELVLAAALVWVPGRHRRGAKPAGCKDGTTV